MMTSQRDEEVDMKELINCTVKYKGEREAVCIGFGGKNKGLAFVIAKFDDGYACKRVFTSTVKILEGKPSKELLNAFEDWCKSKGKNPSDYTGYKASTKKTTRKVEAKVPSKPSKASKSSTEVMSREEVIAILSKLIDALK